MTQVFIVSEDEKRRERLTKLLGHISTSTVDNFDVAPGMMKEANPAVVVVDSVMNGKRALACANEIQARGGNMPLVMCVPDEMPEAINRGIAGLENTYVLPMSKVDKDLPTVVGALSGQRAETDVSGEQPKPTTSIYERLMTQSDEVSKN